MRKEGEDLRCHCLSWHSRCRSCLVFLFLCRRFSGRHGIVTDALPLLSSGLGPASNSLPPLHEPLGYINQFRAAYYPLYNAARASHLLGDREPAGVCPLRKAGLLFA